MRKGERTRQLIIEKTAPVFNTFGFEGTSLSALQEATGLTKGSLYGNFSDKEEMALEAFRYAMKQTRAAVQKRFVGKSSAREKLMALLSFYSDHVFHPPIPGGCPLLNHAVQADDRHAFLRETVSSEIEKTIRFIASLIDEGKRNGEFSRDVRSYDLACVLFTSIEGAIMVCRVSGTDKPMKIVIRNCKNRIDQITLT